MTKLSSENRPQLFTRNSKENDYNEIEGFGEGEGEEGGRINLRQSLDRGLIRVNNIPINDYYNNNNHHFEP